MSKLLDELKLYFKTTPREQVLKDWAVTESNDTGPTVDEFFALNEIYSFHQDSKNTFEKIEYTNYSKKSEEFFGLFLSLN